jgi:hypothetical protein
MMGSGFTNFNEGGNKTLDVLVLTRSTIDYDGFEEFVDYVNAIDELIEGVDVSEDVEEDVYNALKTLVHGFLDKMAAVGEVSLTFIGGTGSVTINEFEILEKEYSDSYLFQMVAELFS